MIVKVLFPLFLLALGAVNAEEEKFTILGMDSLEVHELLKQPPLGPCHGAISEVECIRWVNDSTNVKKEHPTERKLEKWRCCCDSVRDSIDASKKKRGKK